MRGWLFDGWGGKPAGPLACGLLLAMAAVSHAAEPATSTSRHIVIQEPRGTGAAGNLRTMCVRTCDGYYFPVSYGVSSGAFTRDASRCAAMCPGTRVELHYQTVPGTDVEGMISVATGRTYGELSTAFAHRRIGGRPDNCGCGATGSERVAGFSVVTGGGSGFQVIGGNYRRTDETVTSAVEPETTSPFTAEPPLRTSIEPEARPPVEATQTPAERRVRVVGSGFFPDPEAAIDLRAPAPARAR